MANTAGFAEACALARQMPGLAVGLHINLTCGRPVSLISAVDSLVDAHGLFFGKWAFLRQVFRNAFSLSHLKTEIRAQWQVVLDAGITITHVDSHQHVHAVPVVGRIVAEIAHEYGTPVLRTFVETETTGSLQTRMINRLYRRAGRLLYNGETHPCRFWGTDFMNRRNKKRALLQFVQILPPGVHELMCHPAGADINQDYPANRIDRFQELQALCDPQVAEALSARGVRLVSSAEQNKSQS